MASGRPTVWQLVKEAVEALGGKATNTAIRDWILQRYPDVNRTTISCQIIMCTVNHPSRVHYAENAKPRVANGRIDFLFRPERGRVELYQPDVHGRWSLVESSDGRIVVQPSDGTAEAPACPSVDSVDEEPVGHSFAAEAHLRDYLARHLEVVEPGLELFVDEAERTGVEYPTPVGTIDILASDREGGLLVIELKVSRGPDSAAGQVLRYKNWVKRHLAEGRRVRGLIIAQHISDRLCYAIADDPEVSAREYELSLSLRPVTTPQPPTE